MNSSQPRPFVDYYADNDISPVRQDIADLTRHLERRSSLYRSLGIAPVTVRGRSVLEFGPGSGHNALYTASLRPRRYLLVDGNPRGVHETRSLLASATDGTTAIEVVAALVEEFRSDAHFELVLAENLIPFQRDPAAFVRAIGAFVAPGGLLVVTCIDGISHFAEIGRRVMARAIAPATLGLRERVAALRPVFAPHLAALPAMSRPLDDWILDNITHPLLGRTFSIPAALTALGADFDVFGSSPSFAVDWRWYKELTGAQRRFNERCADAYYANAINILDHRHALPAHDPALGRRIAACCENAYLAMQALENGASADLGPFLTLVDELAGLVRPLAPASADSVVALGRLLRGPAHEFAQRSAFDSFFGRGTQYLSFVRR